MPADRDGAKGQQAKNRPQQQAENREQAGDHRLLGVKLLLEGQAEDHRRED